MAVNEQVGSKALEEPKKVLGELIFKDAKHFVKYFITKGLRIGMKYTIAKPSSILYKKSHGGVKKVFTGKERTQYDNNKFLKIAGERKLQNYNQQTVAGLSDKDFEKVSLEDILKALSKRNIKFAVLENRDTGEIKIKMFEKDMHIFENIREDLIKKLQKEKGIYKENKKHKMDDFLKSKFKDKEKQTSEHYKEKDRGFNR